MDFCRLCVRVFDRNSVNSMKFDDFIQCCVMLKSLTDAFKKHDHQLRGVIHINYEQVKELCVFLSIQFSSKTCGVEFFLCKVHMVRKNQKKLCFYGESGKVRKFC